MFSNYGEVKEVTILSEPNQRIALVRMSDPFETFCAIRDLHGKWLAEY